MRAWSVAARRMAGAAWLAAGLPTARAFRRARRDPRPVQEARLLALLRRNAASRYGRRYCFEAMRSVAEYQDRVPVVAYDDLQDEMAAIRRGEPGVLTAEPVLMMEKTAGSTAPSRYVPYTRSLLREFQAGLGAWMSDLYRRRPRLRGGGAYWSVSPLAAQAERTEGGLPVGFEEDAAYFDGLGRTFLERLLVTPAGLGRIRDLESCRYATLRFLLESEDLRFVSVWHPSFLTLLMEAADANADRLIDDVARGTLTTPAPVPSALATALARRLRPRPRRAARLREILRDRGSLRPADVWPDLAVISCWSDGAAAPYAAELATAFPQAELQPKGLLATEGIVSIPLIGHPGAALAVTSHFLELVDEDRPLERPRLADELEVDRTYIVLLTTGGGLYRYALGDRVRVVGHVEATPLVQFAGKDGVVSDLCGEKLHAARVGAVLEPVLAALGLRPAFAMMAPEDGRPPGYALFVELSGELNGECYGLSQDRLAEAARRVEEGLLEGPHYRYARGLGQLAPVRGFHVARGGAGAYLDRCVALGQRAGAVKPTPLHRARGWSAHFEGAFVEAPVATGSARTRRQGPWRLAR